MICTLAGRTFAEGPHETWLQSQPIIAFFKLVLIHGSVKGNLKTLFVTGSRFDVSLEHF